MGNPIVNLFWNSADRRLRAFWRLLIQGSVWFGLQIGLGMAVGLAVLLASILTERIPAQDLLGSTETITSLMSQPAVTLIIEILSFLITVSTVWLAGRILDRRRFADFGFHLSRRWGMDLVFGLLLGGFLMTAVFLFERAAGWVEVTGFFTTEVDSGIFPLLIFVPLIFFICVGIAEELFFRGYQMKNLSEGMNSRTFGAAGAILAATVLSSVVFGFAHAANPNATWISTLNIAAAGVFLALGYILTGELALPIGLHITWNFFQGNVFGFPVSGIQPAVAQFLAIRQGGPDLLTGGVFGPEAGLVGLGAMAVGAVLICLWVGITRRNVSLADSLAESPGKAPPAA